MGQDLSTDCGACNFNCNTRTISDNAHMNVAPRNRESNKDTSKNNTFHENSKGQSMIMGVSVENTGIRGTQAQYENSPTGI